MKTTLQLRPGVEYQIFTRFGPRRAVWSGPWFTYTDCTHPLQNSIAHFDDVYVVDRLTSRAGEG